MTVTSSQTWQEAKATRKAMACCHKTVYAENNQDPNPRFLNIKKDQAWGLTFLSLSSQAFVSQDSESNGMLPQSSVCREQSGP
ncbi:hypothetical protein PoB_004266500 [Plakobranchus ocellatus]|uniref:Uncharacterized protein n=1 Tax=Plakobranchus ocellatus TaxID=259542 RepID=A0AAV4B9H2_9GAST|nr:hypothetical protein PoB_004266500 [Plakobranchus ocellatus]